MRIDKNSSSLMMDSELSTLRMADLIRLQDHISVALRRRFGRCLALAFTDIVDSTSYFMASGDVAGQTLQQRHLDLVSEVVSCAGGRIVDTAGDGSFSCFESTEQAAKALIGLQQTIAAQNLIHSRDEQLSVRSAIHWGDVLTDGVIVKGCAVNLCARLACVSLGGQILVTAEAFKELMSVTQQRCLFLSTRFVKSFPDPVDVFALEWRTDDAYQPNKSVEDIALTKRQLKLRRDDPMQGRHLYYH